MKLEGIFVLHVLAARKALEGLTSQLLATMKGEAQCCREAVGLSVSMV